MSLLRLPLGVLSRQVPVSGRPVVQMGPGRELSCPLLLPGGVRTPVTAFLAQWSLPQSLRDPMPLPHFPVYPPLPPRPGSWPLCLGYSPSCLLRSARAARSLLPLLASSEFTHIPVKGFLFAWGLETRSAGGVAASGRFSSPSWL